MLWNAFSECSRWVRSRITAWARPGSFHSAGFSASAFSSSRRRAAASTSKMPPQQDQRLTDLVGHRLNFGAHGGFLATVRLSLPARRSEEHTSELQSLMRISYAVFCLKKTKHNLQPS